MASKKNIEIFTDTLKDDRCFEATLNVAEAVLDSKLEAGDIVEDIPLLGSVWKVGNSVSDVLLQRKILRFFKYGKEIDLLSRSKGAGKLKSSKYMSEIGETLLSHINIVSTQYQLELLAKLYKSLVLDEISIEDFYQLSAVTNNITQRHIDTLIKIDANYGPLLLNCPAAPMLALNELIYPDFTPHMDGPGNRYCVA